MGGHVPPPQKKIVNRGLVPPPQSFGPIYPLVPPKCSRTHTGRYSQGIHCNCMVCMPAYTPHSRIRMVHTTQHACINHYRNLLLTRLVSVLRPTVSGACLSAGDDRGWTAVLLLLQPLSQQCSVRARQLKLNCASGPVKESANEWMHPQRRHGITEYYFFV